MPDRRTHRGSHPQDAQLFAAENWPRLREAVSDLSWLLTRGYASTSGVKIVGDRYQLDQRQRIAVGRCACSDQARQRRGLSRVEPALFETQVLAIDGYNVLTSVEAALAGGIILEARDGCFRDIASIHGTWRKVEETVPAVQIVGELLIKLGVRQATWYLDSPVSNSGRLKTLLHKTASEHGWQWQVELVPNPDTILSQTHQLVATADSVILDRCHRWVNLARAAIEQFVPNATVVPLSDIKSDSL